MVIGDLGLMKKGIEKIISKIPVEIDLLFRGGGGGGGVCGVLTDREFR